jgi:hypothetical protein
VPVLLLNSHSNILEQGEDHHDRQEKIFANCESSLKESLVLPTISGLEMTDLVVVDPLFAAFKDGGLCGRLKPSDIYLVNSSLMLRFLNRIEREKNEPAYCDKGGLKDIYDAALVSRFEVWTKGTPKL